MDEKHQVGHGDDRASHYDLSALMARGWTARLVKQFLGEPDDTERMTAPHTGRPKNLYCAKRVSSIENHDPRFKAEKDKAAMYSDRVKQTQDAKKKNLAAIVKSIMLPDFDLPLEKILDWANIKIERDGNLAGTPLKRVALENLLDSMTSLAWPLEIFSGHAGIREARILVRNRMLAHL